MSQTNAKSGVPKTQRPRAHGMKALSGLQCPRVRGSAFPYPKAQGSWVKAHLGLKCPRVRGQRAPGSRRSKGLRGSKG